MAIVIEIKPGVGFLEDRLIKMLPDMESLLFLAKLYDLDAQQLSALMRVRFNTNDVVTALLAEGDQHSSELQEYLISVGFEDLIERGLVAQNTTPPAAEILPEVWKSLEIEVASSIKQVAEKLRDVVGHMPGKTGHMVLESMMKLNARRPTIGDYKAQVKHKAAPKNLVVLDVSGSMSESTIRTIINDVVALSWEADAALAIVSSTATYWEPGEYDVDVVLSRAEYAGTEYDTLVSLFEGRHWGVVVTIADYDSRMSAKHAFQEVNGTVDVVLDISLEGRPTFLSECIGVLADEVRPLLVGNDRHGILLS